MPGDARTAAEIAAAAGQLLLEIRSRLQAGGVADEVRAEGDLRAHELILSLLRERFPDDAVLSEEGAREGHSAAGRTWIVDPLDGTREFGEERRADWAVHVALVAAGALTAGAVALPALDLVYSTAPPPSLPPAVERPPRVVVSRTRPAAEAKSLAERLGGVLVPMGSAGAKAMAVVAGEVDVYFHTGGQYIWDSAAPVAVAAAAGLHTSRADGSPLVYDPAEPWLPDLLICRPELASRVLALVAG